MGFGKKQRYIEVFQCSGEDMNNVLIGPQQSSLAMAAQALAGGATHGAAAMNAGGGLLGSGNPSAMAAAAVKSANPSAGLLPPGMLNSLQNHPSTIISNSLVGNQMAAFPNSQPQPPPTPPTTLASSSLDQFNTLQNNALLLNPQNLALLGQGATGVASQLGMNNYSLPPPQSPAVVFTTAHTTPTSQTLTSQANGGIAGLLTNIHRPPINNVNINSAGDATSAAMLNALMANGIPVTGAQGLFPFGVPGIPATALQNSAHSLLVPGSAAQYSNAAGLGGFGGLLLPPTPTSNSALLRLPSNINPGHFSNGADFAFSNQQNQASLLQSQLAAQRLLLSQSMPNANAGLLPTVSLEQAYNLGMPPMSSAQQIIAAPASSNTGKRSFEQAFSTSPGVAAAVAHAAQAAKRANFSYDSSVPQPTISAGPTTYSHVQQPTATDP
jgi:hypothetical protein